MIFYYIIFSMFSICFLLFCKWPLYIYSVLITQDSFLIIVKLLD